MHDNLTNGQLTTHCRRHQNNAILIKDKLGKIEQQKIETQNTSRRSIKNQINQVAQKHAPSVKCRELLNNEMGQISSQNANANANAIINKAQNIETYWS